mmetsp:Transcript_110061/g.236905  ORF Transcript_110061/g.236905 Transcript_110061/m.236905 type:complete len:100 (+) Transcript_110061:2-301(+)
MPSSTAPSSPKKAGRDYVGGISDRTSNLGSPKGSAGREGRKERDRGNSITINPGDLRAGSKNQLTYSASDFGSMLAPSAAVSLLSASFLSHQSSISDLA